MKTSFAAALATIALIGATSIAGTSVALAEPIFDPSAAPSAAASAGHDADFWFEAPDGTRTFDIEDNALVPTLIPGDRLSIIGNVIDVTSSSGELVASLKADLPDGIVLEQSDGSIRAIQSTTDSGAAARRCIGNKWIALGLNIIGDATVCVPFGIATGGIGGFACSAAVGTGITAAAC